MFQKKIAKNSVASSGMYRSLSGPSIGNAMFSRTNWMPSSARLCSLPGTTRGLRSAKKKNARNSDEAEQDQEEDEVEAEGDAARR